MSLVWLGVIVLAIVTEAATAALVSVWFIPAGLVSLVLALCAVPLWIQILAFFLLSLLLLASLRGIARNALHIRHVATNADTVLGERAVVTEAIDNLNGKGQVKVCGKFWTARAADTDARYEVGEVLSVIAIEGVKLICRRPN